VPADPKQIAEFKRHLCSNLGLDADRVVRVSLSLSESPPSVDLHVTMKPTAAQLHKIADLINGFHDVVDLEISLSRDRWDKE
jgi:hypothetical protein